MSSTGTSRLLFLTFFMSAFLPVSLALSFALPFALSVALSLAPVSPAHADASDEDALTDTAQQTTRTLAERELAPRSDGHRPLRTNPGGEAAPPAEPQPFHSYPDAPAFTVVPRQEQVANFPCENCHGLMPPNPEPRLLYSPHTATLEHGSGRIWCLDCHDAENRDVLRTLAGDTPSFDEAYLLCGQCHYQPQKDWYYGAHGKRVGNWQGDRELYNCTHCHNPHAPAVRPRAPEPPPPIRRGLTPMSPVHAGHGVVTGEESHE
jgi:hypothetical protein